MGEVIELDDSDGFAMSDQENQESVSISEQIEVKEVASVVEPIEAMETDSASELVHRDSEEETDSILEHVEAKVTSDCIDDLLEGDDEDTDTKENTQFIDDVPEDKKNYLSFVEEEKEKEGELTSKRSPKKIKLVKQSSKELKQCSKELKG